MIQCLHGTKFLDPDRDLDPDPDKLDPCKRCNRLKPWGSGSCTYGHMSGLDRLLVGPDELVQHDVGQVALHVVAARHSRHQRHQMGPVMVVSSQTRQTHTQLSRLQHSQG